MTPEQQRTAYNQHLRDIEQRDDVVKLITRESIHHDEFDYHTLAQTTSGQQFIVAYCDPSSIPSQRVLDTYPFGQCPTVKGCGLFQAVAMGMKHQSARTPRP